MTATAKMAGRMVGIIMGGTGVGTVVTTGTVATGTVVTPPTPVEMEPPVV